MTEMYSTVRAAVINATGISVNANLSSLKGGKLVLPPTYSGSPYSHNLTQPGPDNVSAWVSIDSPASFGNRIEDKLVCAGLDLDPLRVRVAERTLSTMQMPHRVYDAILRDSILDGQYFHETDIGKAIAKASSDNASALLHYDPAVLLLGGWDSTRTGMKTRLGSRWPAAISVEIHGENAVPIQRAGNRVDPLNIEGDSRFLIEEADGSWRPVITKEDKDLPTKSQNRGIFPRRVKPSELNHGNIVCLKAKGVLVDRIMLSGALSLTRLRRYAFGGDEESALDARTMIALMGLYGVAAVIEDGLDLRRDCELVVDDATWEIHRYGQPAEPLKVTASEALEALKEALTKVQIAKPVLLTAADNLEQLVSRSQ